MLSESTPNSEENGALDVAIGGVLFNVSNFPEKAQSYLLGQDMGPLCGKLVDAVLAAGYRRQEDDWETTLHWDGMPTWGADDPRPISEVVGNALESAGFDRGMVDRADSFTRGGEPHPSPVLYRRRKAGPWTPATKNGGD